MGRRPWFPFYVDDFWQDEAVASMTFEEVGLYLRLLSLQWREGSIPSDPEKLARICGLDGPAMAGLMAHVGTCFPEVPEQPGRMANRRLLEVAIKADDATRKLSEQGKTGARARWGLNGPANGPAIAPPLPKNGPAIAKRELDITTTTKPPSPLLGNRVCTYCGVNQKEVDWAFDMDHFIPVSAGGADDPDNLVLCCHVCNQIKQKRIFKTIEDARNHIHKTLWTKNRARYGIPRTICFGGSPPPGFQADKPPKSKSGRRKTKGVMTPPPQDFKPSELDIKWFRETIGTVPKKRVDLETQLMLSHHARNGNEFVDWNQAWKNWMIREKKMGGFEGKEKASTGREGDYPETSPGLVDED